jgi:hypothetical protein
MLDVTQRETLRSEDVRQHAETENIVEENRQYWKEWPLNIYAYFDKHIIKPHAKT